MGEASTLSEVCFQYPLVVVCGEWIVKEDGLCNGLWLQRLMGKLVKENKSLSKERIGCLVDQGHTYYLSFDLHA